MRCIGIIGLVIVCSIIRKGSHPMEKMWIFTIMLKHSYSTTMLVNANLTMNPAAKIVVNSGSLLLLNQNTTTKATIIVKSGGKLQIQNGAVLNLRNKGCLQVELGGEFVITEGSNVIIEQ